MSRLRLRVYRQLLILRGYGNDRFGADKLLSEKFENADASITKRRRLAPETHPARYDYLAAAQSINPRGE